MTRDGGHRDIIVVGASAGGVEALKKLVAGLPPDLTAAVFVVLHLPRYAPSALPVILARSGPLTATAATDGAVPRQGQIYVAPPDYHLLFVDDRIHLSRGPTENGHRPAVDTLFRSAARAYGAGVTGVVLSGSRDDGTAGLLSIVRAGGTAVVQDPAEAMYPSMPRSALTAVPTALALPVATIGARLGELAREHLPTRAQSRGDEPAAPDAAGAQAAPDAAGLDAAGPGAAGGEAADPESAKEDHDPLADEEQMAELSALTTAELPVPAAGFGCPSCGGSLFELATLPVPRFRCRVGHAWSAGSLLEEQSGAMEAALWTALRALEEKAELSARLAEAGGSRGTGRLASRYDALAEESRRAGELIRDLIDSIGAAGLHEVSAPID